MSDLKQRPLIIHDIQGTQRKFRKGINEWYLRNINYKYKLQIIFLEKYVEFVIDNYLIRFFDCEGEGRGCFIFYNGNQIMSPPEDFAIGLYAWDAILSENIGATLDQIMYYFL